METYQKLELAEANQIFFQTRTVRGGQSRANDQYRRTLVETTDESGAQAWAVWHGNECESVHATLDEALDALFPFYAWPGGYPIEWKWNAEVEIFGLCAACCRKYFRDEPEFAVDAAKGLVQPLIIETNSPLDYDLPAICEICGDLIVDSDESEATDEMGLE